MGTAVLDRIKSPHRNGSELPREDVMWQARQEVRELADRGLSTAEIQERLEARLQERRGFASMNGTERDLVWLIATHEVDRARRT
jgi:hypothetical protein